LKFVTQLNLIPGNPRSSPLSRGEGDPESRKINGYWIPLPRE
jgi:hypothetical protein